VADTGQRAGPAVNAGTRHVQAALSPDGQHLATAGDDKLVRLWRARQALQHAGYTALIVNSDFYDDVEILAIESLLRCRSDHFWSRHNSEVHRARASPASRA
jgi:WD40 repeat protein